MIDHQPMDNRPQWILCQRQICSCQAGELYTSSGNPLSYTICSLTRFQTPLKRASNEQPLLWPPLSVYSAKCCLLCGPFVFLVSGCQLSARQTCAFFSTGRQIPHTHTQSANTSRTPIERWLSIQIPLPVFSPAPCQLVTAARRAPSPQGAPQPRRCGLGFSLEDGGTILRLNVKVQLRKLASERAARPMGAGRPLASSWGPRKMCRAFLLAIYCSRLHSARASAAQRNATSAQQHSAAVQQSSAAKQCTKAVQCSAVQ